MIPPTLAEEKSVKRENLDSFYSLHSQKINRIISTVNWALGASKANLVVAPDNNDILPYLSKIISKSNSFANHMGRRSYISQVDYPLYAEMLARWVLFNYF